MFEDAAYIGCGGGAGTGYVRGVRVIKGRSKAAKASRAAAEAHKASFAGIKMGRAFKKGTAAAGSRLGIRKNAKGGYEVIRRGARGTGHYRVSKHKTRKEAMAAMKEHAGRMNRAKIKETKIGGK